jgi:hypothetical protein
VRPGGGKEKGNVFERDVCKALSRWLSSNSIDNLFTRNIISGGSFTNKVKAADEHHGMPGDIMANHPSAFAFLSLFTVECKHHRDMNLDGYLYDRRGVSSLAKIITKCQKEAAHAGLRPMLVIKQNNRPAQMLVEADAGLAALATVPRKLRLPYHALHSGTMYLFDFEVFRNTVYAERMLAALPPLRKG